MENEGRKTPKKQEGRAKKDQGQSPKYRSRLEQEVHESVPEFEYEPITIQYYRPKKYTPDFVRDPKNSRIWYEVKGYFRSHDEAKKYVDIKNSYPHIELRFIIANPNIRAYPGVQITMGDWLTKQGFQWAVKGEIPDKWRQGE